MDKISLFSLKIITFLVICINSLIFPLVLNYRFYFKIPDEDLKTYNEFQYSEDEIMDFVYSNKTVPDGLYYETLKGSLHFPLEFSTDNFTEANNFIENNYPNYFIHIVETSENEKFFEFITKRNQTHPVIGNYTETDVFRVHKISYIFLNQSDYFLGLPDKLLLEHNESFKIGAFNQRPINSSNTKEVCSYIWFIRTWIMRGYKIANCVLSEDINTTYCMLLEIEDAGGDFGVDIITLVYSKFSINKDNGSISIWREAFDKFEVRYHPINRIDDSMTQFVQILGCIFVFSLLIFFLWKAVKHLSNRFSI
ncbi:MAG: hypothetical protein KAW51_04765 [Candidatus Lokiarchaeota archaeon]|nr:hypothetical protein [Candidatus Lokiarchaeota archaeon]